jgi:hypothetical protein
MMSKPFSPGYSCHFGNKRSAALIQAAILSALFLGELLILSQVQLQNVDPRFAEYPQFGALSQLRHELVYLVDGNTASLRHARHLCGCGIGT